MEHAELLGEFAETRGLSNPDFDVMEVTVLDFGGGDIIEIQRSGDGRSFLLTAGAGVLPSPGTEALARLLAANAAFASSGDPVLSYDPESGEVVIRACIDSADMTPDGLGNSVESMLVELEDWRDFVNGGWKNELREDAGGGETVAPPGPGMMA